MSRVVCVFRGCVSMGCVSKECSGRCVVDNPPNPEADTPPYPEADILGPEANPPPPARVETITEAGGVHPTGMHTS